MKNVKLDAIIALCMIWFASFFGTGCAVGLALWLYR
jgi:hypothetical protein